MKLSCGIIILNEFDEILVGHVSGSKFYDIPKGGIMDNETTIECALRECQEETGLELPQSVLKDIGLFKYNKEKNLHLFLYEVTKSEIPLNWLECTTFFTDKKTQLQRPEMDGYKWVPIKQIDTHFAKSMIVSLTEVFDKLHTKVV